MDGWIEFWNHGRGFGFIHDSNGLSYFAHISSCEAFPPGVLPVKGQLVSFDLGRGDRGPVALNIRLRVQNELEKATSLGGGQ
jgi:cold shock CspA family protein